jgi:oligosaccharyltransferase complex subunit epsilon
VELPPSPSPASSSSTTKSRNTTLSKRADGSSVRGTGTGGDENDDFDGRDVVRVSSERAFADYVFGSLILHGFCVNFIN